MHGNDIGNDIDEIDHAELIAEAENVCEALEIIGTGEALEIRDRLREQMEAVQSLAKERRRADRAVDTCRKEVEASEREIMQLLAWMLVPKQDLPPS